MVRSRKQFKRALIKDDTIELELLLNQDSSEVEKVASIRFAQQEVFGAAADEDPRQEG